MGFLFYNSHFRTISHCWEFPRKVFYRQFWPKEVSLFNRLLAQEMCQEGILAERTRAPSPVIVRPPASSESHRISLMFCSFWLVVHIYFLVAFSLLNLLCFEIRANCDGWITFKPCHHPCLLPLIQPPLTATPLLLPARVPCSPYVSPCCKLMVRRCRRSRTSRTCATSWWRHRRLAWCRLEHGRQRFFYLIFINIILTTGPSICVP